MATRIVASGEASHQTPPAKGVTKPEDIFDQVAEGGATVRAVAVDEHPEPVGAVAGFAWTNWRGDGELPILVNPRSDTHELIAWCWGEARHVENIVAVFSVARPGEHDATVVADLLDARVRALTAMLHHMAEKTANAWPK